MTPAASGVHARNIILAIAAAVLLTLTGAFDTAKQPFHERLIYWMVVLSPGFVWGWFCRRELERRGLDARPGLHIALLTALIAIPMCLFVWVATGLFLEGRVYPASSLPRFVVPVLTVTAAVCALVVLLGQATPRQTHITTGEPKKAKIVERLPPHLRDARLIAVQAEDHYLRVHTDRGSDLILMRLSDALDELDGLEGAQTHRSWWVSKDAVRGASRGDGRALLTLDGDLVAPVSRRYARALREAGWF